MAKGWFSFFPPEVYFVGWFLLVFLFFCFVLFDFYFFVWRARGSKLVFQECGTAGYSHKASFPLLLFSPMPVSHFHAPFQGKGREKANKQDLFPEFMFSKGTGWGGGGRGGVGGLRPAIENCCPYPERSVYTTCKVKQIDPGCRFTCVFVRLPVNLHACHLQSLFSVPD